MKKLFSTKYSAGSFNAAMLLLRLGLGILMIHHGYDKLVHFDKYQSQFIDFMGMGQKISLSLCVFAEFFCSAFLILGLFTRLATIPLIINMCVIIFKVLEADVFGKAESAVLYLTGFIVLLMVGAGKASVDGMVGK
jgi:putative oxidoreductase